MRGKAIGVWLVLALLLFKKVPAQQFAYSITFADKDNSPFSINDPSAYLSARSIARRVAQNIMVNATDLPVNQTYIDSVLTLTGGELHGRSRWQNLCVVLVRDSSLIHKLSNTSFVSGTRLIAHYNTPLHKTKAEEAAFKTSSAYKTTSAESDYYGATWEQTNLVRGSYLHNNSYKGAGKIIAIVDAGYWGTDTHPGYDSLRLSGRIVDTRNIVLATNHVYGYSDHGTKVLSTMAGFLPNNPPTNFVGSAPYAAYALYVTEDETSEQPIELYNLLFAAERADSIGADIISSSLGYNTFDNAADNFVFSTDFDGKTTVAAQAANSATQKGILFVTSAGNEGTGPWGRILTPGDADSALTIGSVDNTKTPWVTSGYGPNAAGQVKPDVCALGHVATVFTAAGGYTQVDGTSLATPQIAGWAACLWQANPAATPYQIRQAIIRCASSYATPGPQIGYGVPNFQCTQQLLKVADTPPPFTPANWVIPMPNPFSGDLNIAVSAPSDGEAEFVLTDMTGKKVASLKQYLYKGSNSVISIPLPGLPCGLYTLKAIAATEEKVVRLEKL